MSNITSNELPNKTIEVWNSFFKYMFYVATSLPDMAKGEGQPKKTCRRKNR